MRLPFHPNVASMSNGKLQHNMECIQFLYDYHQRAAPQASRFYNGFERRIEAYKKQAGILPDEDPQNYKL